MIGYEIIGRVRLSFLYLLTAAYTLGAADRVIDPALDGSNIALFWLIYWFGLSGWALVNLGVTAVRGFRFAVWGIR